MYLLCTWFVCVVPNCCIILYHAVDYDFWRESLPPCGRYSSTKHVGIFAFLYSDIHLFISFTRLFPLHLNKAASSICGM